MRLPSVKSLVLTLIGAAALLIPALTQAAEPKIMRFAFQGELKSVDPYQINESFSLSVNGAVYGVQARIRRGRGVHRGGLGRAMRFRPALREDPPSLPFVDAWSRLARALSRRRAA